MCSDMLDGRMLERTTGFGFLAEVTNARILRRLAAPLTTNLQQMAGCSSMLLPRTCFSRGRSTVLDSVGVLVANKKGAAAMMQVFG